MIADKSSYTFDSWINKSDGSNSPDITFKKNGNSTIFEGHANIKKDLILSKKVDIKATFTLKDNAWTYVNGWEMN